MVLPERQAAQVLEELVNNSNQLLDRQDPTPRLRFDLRGRCAGQALLKSWEIRLNHALLQEHGQAFIFETVPHEWAHLVTFAQFGGAVRPHGREWQSVMHKLGYEPSVCHNYEVTPARKLKHYLYRCGCQQHELSSIRHRRASSGKMTYNCRRCGQTLVLAAAESLKGER